MDSYLQLSPDSSVEPHTPPSTFDMDDMNNNNNAHTSQPQDVLNPYPYDSPDAHSQFWNHHDPRGAYMQDQFYDDRIKLENVPNTAMLRGPQTSVWSEHEQDSVADAHFYRRASFPQVRHDHPGAAGGVDPMHPHAFLHSEPGSFLGPYSNRSDAFYGEPMSLSEHMPLSADPSALHGHPLDEHYLSSASASPHSSIHEFDALDSTHSSPVIVPTQAPFYRAHSTGGLPHPSFLNPHAALPVMHTDDAASKETQYLRRRCFNCHTTEPPSWRRSTLNPGKIVCNKCGLYERTHLRPRPHRFDELRAGSKARKAAANKMNASPGTSPKPKLDGVKKEGSEGEFDISGASSMGSGAVSDWETGSAYSTSSTPNSGFPSPIPNSFTTPLPQSRPSSREGPIRLPNAPLTDIATRLTKVPPAKSSSAPYYVEGRSTTLGRPSMPADMYPRRGSLPVDVPMNPASRLAQTLGMPEVTGWQVVPPPDLSQSPKKKVEAAA